MQSEDSSKQERIEEFMRKSLLGEDLVDTQFHLFSAKSVPSHQITKPRVLCANDVLLTKSSKFFLDLLSQDANLSDGSLCDLKSANDVPTYVRIDDYGYASDSDLDDDDEPVADASEAPKDESATPSRNPPQISITTRPKDEEELSDDGSESISSDMFVMSPEHPETDDPFGIIDSGGAAPVMSIETAMADRLGNEVLASENATRGRSFAGRHILVKDTAFRTWYALLNYLYTDNITFSPLTSAISGGPPRDSLVNSLSVPTCSAKSMYRLARMVGLDHLRDEALAHIRSSLTEDNILKELSCSVVSSHPDLLEMELDVLYDHIASSPVVTGFPALAQCIAHKEIPHGAEIIVGMHARLLREARPLPKLGPSLPAPLSPPASVSLELPSSPPPLQLVAQDPWDTPTIYKQYEEAAENNVLDDTQTGDEEGVKSTLKKRMGVERRRRKK